MVVVTSRRRVRPRRVHLDENQAVQPGVPWSPWEALMVAGFGTEPDWSRLELLELREVLVDALDQLDARQLWVLNAVVNEQKPYSEVAKELGLSKTMAFKLCVQAKESLRRTLEEDPSVKEYLCGR